MCRLMPFLILFPAPVTYRETSKFNDRQSKCKQCFLQEKDGRARAETPGTERTDYQSETTGIFGYQWALVFFKQCSLSKNMCFILEHL